MCLRVNNTLGQLARRNNNRTRPTRGPIGHSRGPKRTDGADGAVAGLGRKVGQRDYFGGISGQVVVAGGRARPHLQ